MKIFNKYINPKAILNILIGIAIVGMFLLLFAVNKINCILNTDLGFEKDSVYTLKANESNVILPKNLVFSSNLPGFSPRKFIDIKSDKDPKYSKFGHQYVSDGYFSFFNYEILAETKVQLLDSSAQLVYLNEDALSVLGIRNINDALGVRLITNHYGELIVCGVVKEYESLSFCCRNKPSIYQLSSEHLAYAFLTKNGDNAELLKSANFISLQQRIQNQYRWWEDILYSAFLFINVIILLICLGYIGNKFASKKERNLYKILGAGVHILTLIISKTYIYLIAIVGFVAGPIALLLQKFWLGIYTYRVQFGLIDLIIILSMVLVTVYLVCCPKRKIEEQLKDKAFQPGPL